MLPDYLIWCILDVLVLGNSPKRVARNVYNRYDKIVITDLVKLQQLLLGKHSWDELPAVDRPKRVRKAVNQDVFRNDSSSSEGSSDIDEYDDMLSQN